MPLVSIVLPTFDRLGPLRATVTSVRAQTFADWELVVADDGSSGPTAAYLRDLEHDTRVRVLWLPHSGSPAVARNAALAAARGEFAAFLDSDDLWEPEKLRLQLDALAAEPDCQWCYSAFTRIDAHGAVLADERGRRWNPVTGDIFLAALRGEASLRTPCVLARRQFVLDAGGFDPAIAACEDYDLWLRLALRSPVVLVDRPLARVRIAPGSYSGQWPHVIYYQIRSIEKLQRLAPPRCQPALRRQRARYSVALAREYRARGDASAMTRTLLASFPFAWRYPASWLGALRALLGI